MTELWKMTAWQLGHMLDRGEITADDILKSVSGRIGFVEPHVKAYIKVVADPDSNSGTISAGDKGEGAGLFGVSYALKDNLCTAGIPTTCGSRILSDFVPSYDATVVASLKRTGATLVGKTNLDEFSMGSSCENSAFFPTRNPWDLQRVAGGSSGGSAAAVAAGEAIFALGSDTGGSVREPASFCGVVGFKPTYGLISRYGMAAFSSSLDQIGPITRDVRDCARVLKAIAGQDPLDSTSAAIEIPDYEALLLKSHNDNLNGIRIGVPKEYFMGEMEPGVKEAVQGALKTLEGLGAEVTECSLPHTEYALSVYYIITSAEASSNLARYDGIKYGYRSKDGEDLDDLYLKTREEGFGPEVKFRLILGTYALSAGCYNTLYLKAQKARGLIQEDFAQAFDSFDVLVGPTTPTVAFKVGERVNSPLSMYFSDTCTVPAGLAGLPAISVPCGFSEGLPVGLQIIGRRFDEVGVLKVAYAYEQEARWHLRFPDIERQVKDRA